MNWFQGSIVEAIQAAKNAKGTFVVFIHDETDLSKSAMAVLNERVISDLLGSEDITAIKLAQGCLGSNQFAAIYPLVLVPSLFFIDGNDGIVKEVVSGFFEKEVLIEKITKIKHSSLENDSTENNELEPPTKNSTTEVQTEAVKNVEDPKDEAVSSNKEEVNEATGTTVQEPIAGDVQLEDKIERAKAMTAELQRTRQQQKEEAERMLELERRKRGQELAQAQIDKDELKRGHYNRERKRQKEEDKLARERVKAQIAADRAEREARQAILRGENPTISQNKAPADKPPRAEGRDSITSRIKFRMTDGSSMQAQFDSDDKLSCLHDHLVENGVPAPIVMCSSMHPKAYSADEMQFTLHHLDLVPSAIIIVKTKCGSIPRPQSNMKEVVTSTGDKMFNFILWMLTPFCVMYNYLAYFITYQPSPNNDIDNEDNNPNERSQKKKKNFRRDGNIHRLGNLSDDDDDADDDNNTWNGNSTQQM